MRAFGIGALIGAVFALPFFLMLLPWPVRVRMLAAAQFGDPVLGTCAVPRLDLREARVVEVAEHDGHVEVVVHQIVGRHVRRAFVLRRDGCPPGIVARLEGWSAVGTTLLLSVEEGDFGLYGPGSAVTGFAAEPRSLPAR